MWRLTPIVYPLFAFLLFAGYTLAFAGDVRVRGYTKRDGTYVQPHYRSAPDGNPYNNWSYPGNINPYTGKVATGSPSNYISRYCERSPYNQYCRSISNPPSLYSSDKMGSGSDSQLIYQPHAPSNTASRLEEGRSVHNNAPIDEIPSCGYGYSWDFSVGGCKKIVPPLNASLNPRGTGWNCDIGFRINPETVQCEPVTRARPGNPDTSSSIQWRCSEIEDAELNVERCSRVYVLPYN